MRKILVIDDDTDNLSLLKEMLIRTAEILTSTSGTEGIRIAGAERPDLILLDVNMPELDGFETLKLLREKPHTATIPVIMLTTVSGLDSRVKGLDLGADDYITKPFHSRELIARVNARMRRTDVVARSEEVIAVANMKLDPKSAQVWVDGEEKKLTRIEFDLLRYFLERPNQLIARKQILADLWPDTVVTQRTVDTHLGNVRKKTMGFLASIETVYGSGYILKTTG